MVATDQAEKSFMTFYQNFPDFSESNFEIKFILKYIIEHFKLYKAFKLILIQLKNDSFLLNSIIKLPVHHLNHLCMIDVCNKQLYQQNTCIITL